MDKSSGASRLWIRASVAVGSGRRRTHSRECREETAFPMEKRRALVLAPACVRGRRTEPAAGRTPGPAGGESSPGCEESGGEHTHEDVDMNSGHESSSGNDSLAGSRHHRSSANCSPGSTTGSGSSKRYNNHLY